MSALQVVLAVAAGAALTVERKSVAQLMLARPLVAATLVAALLGEPEAGLAAGAVLELFFLGATSYGASTPHHDTLAALFAAPLAAAAWAAGPPVALPGLALSVMLALPMALVGRAVEATQERWNVTLVDRAEEQLAEGRTARAMAQPLWSLLPSALLGAAVTALATLVGPPLVEAVRALDEPPRQALVVAGAALFGLAAALGARTQRAAGSRGLVAVGAAVTVAGWALWAFAT